MHVKSLVFQRKPKIITIISTKSLNQTPLQNSAQFKIKFNGKQQIIAQIENTNYCFTESFSFKKEKYSSRHFSFTFLRLVEGFKQVFDLNLSRSNFLNEFEKKAVSWNKSQKHGPDPFDPSTQSVKL